MKSSDPLITLEELKQNEDRLSRLEKGKNDQPLYQLIPIDYDPRIPPAENVEWVNSTLVGANYTVVTLRWLKPLDHNIERFEVWIQNLSIVTNIQPPPYLAASVTDAPAIFNIPSGSSTSNYIAIIRTRMKNGMISAINASPSVTFQVLA